MDNTRNDAAGHKHVTHRGQRSNYMDRPMAFLVDYTMSD